MNRRLTQVGGLPAASANPPRGSAPPPEPPQDLPRGRPRKSPDGDRPTRRTCGWESGGEGSSRARHPMSRAGAPDATRVPRPGPGQSRGACDRRCRSSSADGRLRKRFARGSREDLPKLSPLAADWRPAPACGLTDTSTNTRARALVPGAAHMTQGDGPPADLPGETVDAVAHHRPPVRPDA